MSDPDNPSSEDENAVPMPASGAERPAFKSLKSWTLSDAFVSSVSIARPTDWIVSSKPQNVPSRPRNTSSPTI